MDTFNSWVARYFPWSTVSFWMGMHFSGQVVGQGQSSGETLQAQDAVPPFDWGHQFGYFYFWCLQNLPAPQCPFVLTEHQNFLRSRVPS